MFSMDFQGAAGLQAVALVGVRKMLQQRKQVWHLPLSLSLGLKVCFPKAIPALLPSLCWETYQRGQAWCLFGLNLTSCP